MGKDIHRKPFDEGTLIKLEIFRQYLREWLPTFLYDRKICWNDIRIIDFFAGEGRDSIGNPGSPIIILEEIKNHLEQICQKDIKIKVLLNEIDTRKLQSLEKTVKECRGSLPVETIFEKQDFQKLFNTRYEKLHKTDKIPRLILFFKEKEHIYNEQYHQF